VHDLYLDIYETCEHLLAALQVALRDMEHDRARTKGKTVVDVSKRGVTLEAGTYNFQGYSTAGERRQVSTILSVIVFPYSFAQLKCSLKVRTHTRPKSESTINTCQCGCEYIARQYIDTDISVQHNV
jgi:hypothetical protein